jgi:NADH dehydrogenase
MPNELNVVTGAFSYSGRYIAQVLLDQGMRVRTLTSRPASSSPFGDRVEVAPFNFDDPMALAQSLEGATTVFNTYWIRFPYRGMTYEHAVANIRRLIDAARRVGVRKFIHISITNASPSSALPYFSNKGVLEQLLLGSGVPYTIIRPAIIFGREDILLNNIAWLLRKYPLFAIPGDGSYRVQPVFVEDLAHIAVDAARATKNATIEAVGPEIFTFNDLVALLKRIVGSKSRVIHVAPVLALPMAKLLGKFLGDRLLTRDEMLGLMANMLVSRGSPTATTRFSEWAEKNAANLGRNYSSEIGRRREAASPPAHVEAAAAAVEPQAAVEGGDKHPNESGA